MSFIKARFYVREGNVSPVQFPAPGKFRAVGFHPIDQTQVIVEAEFKTKEQVHQFWPHAYKVQYLELDKK